MNIIVFDTETTSFNKPFCYNVGWVIFNTDTRSNIIKRDYVVEQIWHNSPLFSTAYYANKRPIYVSYMRTRKTIMNKWGYIMQQMARDIKTHNVEFAYAYNSPFDDKVFSFNCDWFKTNNPLDTIPILDICGLVGEYITNTPDYKNFCEAHQFFTEAENYSATAETVYRYLTNECGFEEAHTALADSEIETFILERCIDLGGEIGKEYAVTRTLFRKVQKPLTIKVNQQVIYNGTFVTKIIKKNHIIIKT